MTTHHLQRALQSVSAAFDAQAAENAALVREKDATITRYRNAGADLTQRVIAAEAALKLCQAANDPPHAIVEATLPGGATIVQGVAWLHGQLGRALQPGEVARLHIPPTLHGPILMGGEDHAWWSRGTLEIASVNSQYVAWIKPVQPEHKEGILIQSSAATQGTCRLVLRNVGVLGSIVISCPGGLVVQMLGASTVSSVPREATPSPH